jgi:hypothetical protein
MVRLASPFSPLAVLLVYAATASAETKASPTAAACISAAGDGQTARDAHKLIEARNAFRVCAAASCPSTVRNDCVGWLSDAERAVPSVVLSAIDGAGRDVTDAKVTYDGVPLASRLDGEAVPVNPGAHTFRFERPDGSVGTTSAVVKEGVKAASVSVSFGAGPNGTPAPMVATAPSEAPGAPASASRWSGLRVASVVVGGVGVVGVGAGIALGFAAKGAYNAAFGEPGEARHTDSESAANEGNVATGILVAGGVLAAAGVVMWFVAPPNAGTKVGVNGRGVWVSF